MWLLETSNIDKLNKDSEQFLLFLNLEKQYIINKGIKILLNICKLKPSALQYIF